LHFIPFLFQILFNFFVVSSGQTEELTKVFDSEDIFSLQDSLTIFLTRPDLPNIGQLCPLLGSLNGFGRKEPSRRYLESVASRRFPPIDEDQR
jgi:hypothetical protein